MKINNMLARLNPFNTSKIRMIPYQWRGLTPSQLLCNLEQNQFRGSILGPHGSGKSTLLRALRSLLENRGFKTVQIFLNRDSAIHTLELFRHVIFAYRTSSILFIDGADLLSWPHWTLVRWFAFCLRGVEGIVAKKKESKYEPGKRSGAWVKYKTEAGQEFVIGGYKPSERNKGLDAILVGYYEDGKLMYAGSVRAGFTPHTRKEVETKLKKLVIKKCPFANLPEESTGRWGEGLTAEDMEKCVWVKPKLVCRIDFVEWTEAGHLRHAKFAGVVIDKDPTEVVRENS